MLTLNRPGLLRMDRVVDYRHTWILSEDYRVEFVDYPHVAFQFVIPKGFDFDFASVPLLFQGLFPRVGTLSDVPALIHDWLYATQIVDRKTADKLFYDAMRNLGVPKLKAWTMYRAVRLGGGLSWRKATFDEINFYRALGGLGLLND